MYRYIQAEKADDPEARVAVMCRVLGVSRSGYYDWCLRGRRPVGGRCADNLALIEQIRRVHERFRYYGSPRIREVPALALTAFARTEDRDRALAAGFQEHVAKPVDLKKLVGVVSRRARR